MCLCVLLRDGGAAIKRQHAVSHEVLMPRISCSNVIHIPSAIQPARLMYESTRDFISTPPPPLSFYQHLFHTPTLTYPTPCRLFNPSSSSRACTEPPLLCLNAYVGFYRTQSKQSRARDSEREKRGEREIGRDRERERERASVRERECNSDKRGTCTLSAHRSPPCYIFNSDTKASKREI